MIQLWFAFLAGLAGSFHCIGMCGGIVAALSMGGEGNALRPRLRSQLAYNLGRIGTYTALGALAGFAGSTLDLLTVKAVSFWFLVLANLFVLAVGISSALGLRGFSLSSLEGTGASLLALPLRRAVAGSNPFGALYLGAVLGFLPCGLIYAPLIAAAASGSAWSGGATMAAMGLGTVPALLIFGTASTACSARLRSSMLRIAGIAVALIGAAGLWRALARASHI